MDNSKRVDLINIGLIMVSLILALIMPFRLFLIAYAILGPLHYLTEVNWLHEKDYFLVTKKWLVVGAISVTLIVLPKVASFLNLIDQEFLFGKVMLLIDSFSNGVIFLTLWTSACLILVEDHLKRVVGILAGVIIAYLFDELPVYVLVIGLLIPTVIHVYLFTGLFMLYGALKSNSKYGMISVVALLLAPVIIGLVEIPPSFYNFSDEVKNTFIANRFHLTCIGLAKMLGIADGKSFFFYGKWELKMQAFIAFAYIYHYLNWFSKTAIIGWHRGLQGGKAVTILVLWLAFAGLFLVDYRIGFYSALSLSFLHVILEFPLNVVSIQGIGRFMAQRFGR